MQLFEVVDDRQRLDDGRPVVQFEYGQTGKRVEAAEVGCVLFTPRQVDHDWLQLDPRTRGIFLRNVQPYLGRVGSDLEPVQSHRPIQAAAALLAAPCC